jgi:hypothetical protein
LWVVLAEAELAFRNDVGFGGFAVVEFSPSFLFLV